MKMSEFFDEEKFGRLKPKVRDLITAFVAITMNKGQDAKVVTTSVVMITVELQDQIFNLEKQIAELKKSNDALANLISDKL